jgi:hypothetical protein
MSFTNILLKESQHIDCAEDIDELYLETSEVSCKAKRVRGGFIVFRGSEVIKDVSKDFNKKANYYHTREILIKEKVIQEHNNKYIFVSDYKFTGVGRSKYHAGLTQATAVILGYPPKAKDLWKNKFGKTLGEIILSEEDNRVATYSRESVLKKSLNSFFEKNFNLPRHDYYSDLDIRGFLQLKTAIGDINNILTMKLSLAFADWIDGKVNFDSKTKESIKELISTIKPNTNGYDIKSEVSGKLIAEVKCVNPINNSNEYGSSQKNGIIKDIKELFSGKGVESKSNPNYYNNYYKFMVFLDTPEIRLATEQVVKNKHLKNLNVNFFEKNYSLPSTGQIPQRYLMFCRISTHSLHLFYRSEAGSHL